MLYHITIMKKTKSKSGPHSDPFAQLLGYHLRRLSVLAMNDLTQALAPLGLKPADASVLFAVAAHADITQSDIGRLLGIRRANMTPLIAALERRGLVDRKPVDGRSQGLGLAAKGQAICRQAQSITRRHEERLFGSIPVAERGRLIAQLRALWQSPAH
jgi:DNA-binding MarR family transcriptional regulator